MTTVTLNVAEFMADAQVALAVVQTALGFSGVPAAIVTVVDEGISAIQSGLAALASYAGASLSVSFDRSSVPDAIASLIADIRTFAGNISTVEASQGSTLGTAVLNRPHIDPGAIMANNDMLGDCTSAGLPNSIRAVSALNGFQTAITNEDAVAFYSASTGYTPADPASDQGGVEADVLAYAAREGYRLADQTLYPIWGTIDPTNRNSLALACAALGPVYLGVQLAVADQSGVGGTWDTETPDSWGDRTPGSWGGHCLLLWGYTGLGDEDVVTLLTWGTTQRATWRWLRSRIMEAHGLLWKQLASPTRLAFLSVADVEDLIVRNTIFLAGVES